MTAPGTPSGITTGRPTASSRRWTPGARRWTSSPSTSARTRQEAHAMCTMIAMHADINGCGHPTASAAEHALLLDFVNHDMGPSARVAVEMDLASGRALIAQLQAAIEAAEMSGVREYAPGQEPAAA